MKIVYINSPARTGKDSFCDFCAEFLRGRTISTVDQVKIIAREDFGWDGSKDAKGRKLLAALRYAWGEYNDGPVKSIGKLIKQHENCIDIMFVMVREYKEMMKMQKLYGGETLTVKREVEICPTEQKFLDDIPKNFKFDHCISNERSLSNLKLRAKQWCKEL